MNESYRCPKCGQPVPPNAPEGLCPRCLGALNLDSETGFTAPGATAVPPPPSAAELAPHFPQLEILEVLGRGGMGVVYKVRQKELDRIAALKILPPGIGGDPAFAERFAREAKALARLNHPGIVTIYDSGRTDGLFYFLMEFVDGVSLGRLMHGGRVSPREALAIVPQICDALQYAHDQGIIHRDIKPENILLDRQGRVKVADFGIAKLVAGTQQPLTSSLSPSDGEKVAGRPGEGRTAALTDAGKVMGTPAYMAPEQAEHPADVDHRVDIYALGVVFYQMLTGELPGKRIEPPSRKVQIDVHLDEIVLRALEREPERRYQTAGELKTVVETVAAEPRERAGEPGVGQAQAGPPVTKPGAGSFAAGTGAGTIPQGATVPLATRWSRAALAGAGCVGFFLFVIVLWLLDWPPSRDPSFGRTLPQILFRKAVLPAGFAALLAGTILGWIAMARIRRSAGGLRGMRWAAFDGLFLPLLTVNCVILYVWAFAVKALAASRGLGGSMFRNLWDFAAFVLLLGLAAGWVNYLIIRPVWRAIAGSAGGDAPSSGTRTRRNLRLLAATLGLAVTFLVPAYMMLNENSRKARYGWGVETGTELHYQVFEADAGLVDRLVPFDVREPGNAVFSTGAYTLAQPYTAVAQMAEINGTVLTALLQHATTNSGLLVNAIKKGEDIYQWSPDAWSYTNAQASGKGEGFCGMGSDMHSIRFRIRYQVSHLASGSARYPVTAEISYEGRTPPQDKARAFFIPFGREQQAKYLVIVFGAKADSRSTASEPPPTGAVDLKLKWPPVGERIVWDVDLKRNGEYLISGQPDPLKEDLTLGKKYGFTVLKATLGGGHEVELEFLSFRGRIALGGKSVLDYDSSKESSAHMPNPLADMFGKVVGSKILYFLNASNEVERRAIDFTPLQAQRFDTFLAELEIQGYTPSKEPGIRSTQRYWAPSLAGVWARSPYLHNGSVRTMQELFSPAAARSRSFRRGSRVYDTAKVGYTDEGVYVLDTTAVGSSNAGHEYGADLSNVEKVELIEYLKTL
jgi:predicted Ser/Thr protein kinase